MRARLSDDELAELLRTKARHLVPTYRCQVGGQWRPLRDFVLELLEEVSDARHAHKDALCSARKGADCED